MELRAHCAYNQTRECFLGLEVEADEFSYADLEERLAEQELKSGEGLWLNPFHGIPMTGLFSPLDLIYLDEDCRVIEAVESYPTFLASPSRPRAPSVLVLPAHSIYSSQTQMGDQLVLCVAEEMGRRLERISERPSPDCEDSGRVACRARFCSASSPFGAAGQDCWNWGTAQRTNAAMAAGTRNEPHRARDQGRQAAEKLAGAVVVA